MHVDDLGGGVHTPRDGWCDPNGMLQGFRRKASRSACATCQDRVAGLDGRGRRRPQRQRWIPADASPAGHFVNAAGAWSRRAWARWRACRSRSRRCAASSTYFTRGNPIERLPYVKDLQRMAFRSEGAGFSGGVVDGDEPRGFNFEVDHGYFERVVWPAVAHRFPPLEAAKCHRTWAGLYEQCELDGNPIFGNWPGRLDNFHVCAGFSGHGMMHAPAAGRGDGRADRRRALHVARSRALRLRPRGEGPPVPGARHPLGGLRGGQVATPVLGLLLGNGLRYRRALQVALGDTRRGWASPPAWPRHARPNAAP